MAMDNFKEEVVVRRHNGLANVTYYFSWVMLVILGIFGLLQLQATLTGITTGSFSWIALLIGVVALGIAVLIWLKKDTLRVEYEYTFTNGVLDVSMVLNNSKRKYLAEIPLKLVESCGSVTHQSFNRYLNDKMIKRHNWFLNRDNDLIYLYFNKNGVRHLAVIEPSADMQAMMRSKGYLNFGVWQENK